MEVSLTVADHDITRADERAAIMERITQKTTIPIVVAAHVDDARQQLAQDRNVTLITVGE